VGRGIGYRSQEARDETEGAPVAKPVLLKGSQASCSQLIDPCAAASVRWISGARRLCVVLHTEKKTVVTIHGEESLVNSFFWEQGGGRYLSFCTLIYLCFYLS
jgi:hypothetical protein